MNKFIKGLIRASVILVAAFLIVAPIAAFLPINVSADATSDLYWLPDATSGTGTGNWSATGATGHWATAPDGTDLGHAAPTATNNVYFGANAFNGAGQVVTVDAAANCLSMSWIGATNTPTFAGSQQISVYANCIFISAMTSSHTGNIAFAGAGAMALTTNGLALNSNVVAPSGLGTVTFQDNVNIGTKIIYVNQGVLDTNGVTITCGTLRTNGAAAKTITLGASTINCSVSFDLELGGGALTLNAGTSVVNNAGNFGGYGKTYNTVNLTGASSTITGSNTITTLGLTRVGVQTITFTDGTTQTIGTLTRNVGTQVKTLQGSGAAGWAITKSGGGTIYNDYLSVSRSTASPASTFIAGVHSVNGGNNTDWVFVAAIVTNDETNLNAHETTLNGTITANGSNATRRGFQYGLTSGALDLDWHQDGSYGTGAYAVQLTGIASDTTYYYRAYAVTGGITEYGAEGSFTTRDTAWLLLRFILPIVVAFGLILGVIGAWGGSGKITIIGVAIGLAGFVMIQAIIGTL